MSAERIERIAQRFEGRWMQGYVRGKLRHDPAFAAAVEILRDTRLPVLDIGCGAGLLACWLREHGVVAPFTGFDFDARKIDTARAAVASHYAAVDFTVGDVSEAREFSGNVVMFDVLHYLAPEAQTRLLASLPPLIAPGGCCLVRFTPRDQSWRFRVTQMQEMLLHAIAWMKAGGRHFATREEIVAPLEAGGLRVEVRPMWGSTPFNSHLLVARRKD